MGAAVICDIWQDFPLCIYFNNPLGHEQATLLTASGELILFKKNFFSIKVFLDTERNSLMNLHFCWRKFGSSPFGCSVYNVSSSI